MPESVFDTPVGRIGLHWIGETLIGVDLEPPATFEAPIKSPVEALGEVPDPTKTALGRKLNQYFADATTSFDLSLDLGGTPFQQRVWAAIRAIPPGSTRTYRDLARDLGTAPRAVGQACRANPCPIVVPCHRVVAVNGLGGFAGDLTGRKLTVKRWLLRHEGVAVA